MTSSRKKRDNSDFHPNYQSIIYGIIIKGSKNGGVTIPEVARLTGLAENAVQYHVEVLEKNNLIKDKNMHTFGKWRYYIEVKKYRTTDKQHEILLFLSNNPQGENQKGIAQALKTKTVIVRKEIGELIKTKRVFVRRGIRKELQYYHRIHATNAGFDVSSDDISEYS